ncbi:MAG: hypothetical protein ACFFGZ_16805, partial [Candidatus Thorarchaeota archaeon]
LTERDKIIANYAPLTIPDVIWSADTEIRNEKDIPWRECFPYILREKRLYSLAEFTAENILSAYIDLSSVQKHLVKDMIEDETHRRYLSSLLNRWISLLLELKGLRYDKRTNCKYFIAGRTRVRSWHSGKRWSERKTVNFYPDDQAEAIDYVTNQAIRAFVRIIDDNPYLFLIPRLILTSDGFNCLSGPQTKNILDSFAKDPVKSYNPNQRNDLLFWYDFIAKRPRRRSRKLEPYLRKRRGRDIKKEYRKIMIDQLSMLIKIERLQEFAPEWRPNSEPVRR